MEKLKKGAVTASAGAVLVALMAMPANAQQAQRATMDIGNAYVGLSGGIIIPDDVHDTYSGTITGSSNTSFKTGAAVTGFAGYHFNNFIAGEAELGYAAYDYDKASGTLSSGGTTLTGSIGVNGDVTAWTGFANAIITPLGRAGFSPYIGGGLGFASVDAKINSVTLGGTTLAVNSKRSETDFAANILAGFDFPVSNNFALGARYRFVWINSGGTSTSSGTTTKEDNATAHVISVTAKYRF